VSTLVHLPDGNRTRWAVRRQDDGRAVEAPLPASLADLLAMPLAEARPLVESATDWHPVTDDVQLLPPVDRQEVWAAGVTYLRSRDGRAEESAHASMYDLVYDAERPEVFLKATAERVVPPGAAVGIRADSGWDVPEPEVGLVVNSRAEVFGYVAGNDMSSRSIEGENPLYLPQAKIYSRSCALGPGIVPAWERSDGPVRIAMQIERDGQVVFEGSTSTADMRRSFGELVDWLFRAVEFPAGVVLLTGTGVVPGGEFTLREGDRIVVDVSEVGVLSNPVTVVGR
jgi:2-dehydro-3-deoxy-D-arabinonate dehydratase